MKNPTRPSYRLWDDLRNVTEMKNPSKWDAWAKANHRLRVMLVSKEKPFFISTIFTGKFPFFFETVSSGGPRGICELMHRHYLTIDEARVGHYEVVYLAHQLKETLHITP